MSCPRLPTGGGADNFSQKSVVPYATIPYLSQPRVSGQETVITPSISSQSCSCDLTEIQCDNCSEIQCSENNPVIQIDSKLQCKENDSLSSDNNSKIQNNSKTQCESNTTTRQTSHKLIHYCD